MSNLAIKVKHLGKQYTLGGEQLSYSTFRETLVNTVKEPLRWLKGVRKTVNDKFWALDDISFEVKHGEAIGIIGRNGAGKSTLLKILSRITSPTRGRVDIYGRVGSLLEVGTGFHPELTGRENIYLNGAILGMNRIEIIRKFDGIVDFSGIENFLDTPVKHYSSGMYVRLAFAVAAHLEPEILVVDEVLAVGDAEFQKKCLGKMGDVAHTGRTVIFVSHQLDMIRALCERTILLHKGQIVISDTSERAITRYIELNRSQTSVSAFNVKEDPTLSIQVVGGRVFDKDNNPLQTFDIFDQIYIEIDYIIRKPLIGAIIQLELTHNGSILFWSFDSDTDEQRIKIQRQIGTFRSRIQLPSPLLKAGHYFLSLYTGIANSKRIHSLENIIEFDVEIISRGATYLSCSERRPGIIATALIWDTEKIG